MERGIYLTSFTRVSGSVIIYANDCKQIIIWETNLLKSWIQIRCRFGRFVGKRILSFEKPTVDSTLLHYSSSSSSIRESSSSDSSVSSKTPSLVSRDCVGDKGDNPGSTPSERIHKSCVATAASRWTPVRLVSPGRAGKPDDSLLTW